MPRLESLFSGLVTQPYLDEPFPVRIIDPTEDRVRKHLTFLTDEDSLTLRVRAVDRNYIVSSVVTQKRVPTRLLVRDIHDEMFRLKSVLSESDHGVTESYWVTKKNVEKRRASSHNQFRIRGISKESWRSDWVYSELRDFDNDLIVYNMLYDMLDIMLSAYDNEIDYVMDYVLSDTFIKIIQETAPGFSTTLDPEEVRQFGIAEWLSVMVKQLDNHPQEEFVSKLGESFLALSNEMKKDFNENVMSSPNEFYDLYRVYPLFDQHITTRNDFTQMLVEHFLEERFEKIIQKTDIEVLLQNEEEMSIYLQGTYKLDIKKELIDAVCDASPTDRFVTCLNDAVQLLSEPVVYDTLVYDKNEEIEKFLRMAISELFAPFAATDVRLLELEHELEDEQDLDTISSIVEFMMLSDDVETRFLMVYDIVELLIKGDLDLQSEYEVTIVDRMLDMINDSRKALLIDYEFGEFLDVFMEIGESFKQKYDKEFGKVDENAYVQMVDKLNANASTNAKSFSEIEHVSLIDLIRHDYSTFKASVDERIDNLVQEALAHKDVSRPISKKESIHSKLQDYAAHSAIYDTASFEDSTSIGHSESSNLLDVLIYLVKNEHSMLALKDKVNQLPTKLLLQWSGSKVAVQQDLHYILYKLHLREPNRYPLLENLNVGLDHALHDFFFIKGEDFIQYSVRETDDDGWPLGVFRLGTNTLKGEAQKVEVEKSE